MIAHLNLNITSTEAHTEGGVLGSIGRSHDYFYRLTKNQVVDLYNLYKLDFLLFSYLPDEFLNFARGELSSKEKNELPKVIRRNRRILDNPNKNNLEHRKGLEYLNRAKVKQTSQIQHFNNQFSLSKSYLNFA